MIDINTLIEKFRNSCNDDLPGEVAQKEMLAIPRVDVQFPKSEEHAIPSAVLILLYQDKDDIRFFLTERTEHVQHHKGQISLPGGSWEEGEHLHETAMREAEEEIGVPMDDIDVITELTPLFVKVTGYIIHPFVGTINYIPKLVIHEGEVNDDFSVSLKELLNPDTKKIELWTIRNTPVDVPFFQFGKYKVWGATAMILSEFKHCLEACIE